MHQRRFDFSASSMREQRCLSIIIFLPVFFFLPSINAYLRARTRVMPSAVTVNTRGTVLLVDNSLGGLEVNIIVNSTHMHRTILRPMIEETERGRGI